VSRRGISLAELILCFFLLGLVVVLIFNLYPTSVASVRYSGQRLQANALAESLLQQQLARPFSQLVPGPPQALPGVDGQGTRFQPTLEIFPADRPATKPGLLMGLRVRVSWVDRQVPHEVVREVTRVYAP